jgi:hypothetical protein
MSNMRSILNLIMFLILLTSTSSKSVKKFQTRQSCFLPKTYDEYAYEWSFNTPGFGDVAFFGIGYGFNIKLKNLAYVNSHAISVIIAENNTTTKVYDANNNLMCSFPYTVAFTWLPIRYTLTFNKNIMSIFLGIGEEKAWHCPEFNRAMESATWISISSYSSPTICNLTIKQSPTFYVNNRMTLSYALR